MMTKVVSLVSTEQGFSVQGSVSFANAVELRAHGEQLMGGITSTCEIDLSLMRDQDASSVSLLLCWMRFAQKTGKTIQFTHASFSLVRMQKLFGLEKIIQLARN